MKIEKEVLKKALEIVKPGLGKNDIIEQSTSFCFLNENVVTYNDEISIACPIPGLELEGAINANELYAFINKVKDSEIEMTLDVNQLIFKSGRAKAGMILQSEILLPLDSVGTIEKWKKLPTDFIKGISFAMASCSRDMSKPILTCVHVNKGVIESSDNYRLTSFNLENEVPVAPFLLPASSCQVLVRMNPVSISKGEGWIHFKTKNGAVLSCRIFEETYMDISKFLKVSGKKVIFPKGIIEIIDRALIFAKRENTLDEMITLEVVDNRMTVKSESASGWFSENARASYEGDSILFNITPYLLKDILSETNEAYLTSNSLYFKGEDWIYLSMLKS